jgi:hypothetical protein
MIRGTSVLRGDVVNPPVVLSFDRALFYPNLYAYKYGVFCHIDAYKLLVKQILSHQYVSLSNLNVAVRRFFIFELCEHLNRNSK